MAAAATVAPLPLQEWIRRARVSFSKEDYLDCAITVALGLTNRLRPLVETETRGLDCETSSRSNNFDPKEASNQPFHSPLPIHLEDIVPENVIVLAEATNDASRTANFMATEVKIIQSTTTNSGPCQNFDLKTPQPHLCPRDVCFELGKILFELFSRGDPLLLIDLGSNNENKDSFSDLLLGDIDLDEDGIAPPASKDSSKKTSLSAAANTTCNTPPTSLKGKFYLEEQGLPLSVCRLVADLLEAEKGNQFISDMALLSLDEAQVDLILMKAYPRRFLHNQTCPRQALDNTCLFHQTDGQLFGREKEKRFLMDAATRVTVNVPSPCGIDNNGGQGVIKEGTFLGEAAFISGHSGSGKSSIIKELVSFCNAQDWTVLFCKFDRQVAPLSILLQSVDVFFGKFVPQVVGGESKIAPSLQETWNRISWSIASSIDSESFTQLGVILPNFNKLLPFPSIHPIQRRTTDTQAEVEQHGPEANGTNQTRSNSTQGVVGSGRNRLNYLFNIIFKALCSGGHPVVIILEDLQWSDASTLDIIDDFIQTAGCGSFNFDTAGGVPLQGGLLYLGSFRDNEVDEGGFVSNHIRSIKNAINVSNILICELTEHDINQMLSFKFCLPMRCTRQLAQLVFRKTRGHPLYTIEFLRSIIQRNLLIFSVKEKRWVWDDACIDMQLISEGVVELLREKLKQLPNDVIETLKVASCFGSQVNMSTIQLLDLGQFVFSMTEALDLAMKEGIIKKTGDIFAFSHDMLQESTYNLIPVDERKPLHKKIGRSLALDLKVAQNSDLCIIAADQINLCKDLDGILSPVEKPSFAQLNLAAGKRSLRASSFEQARKYFEAGISLLQTNRWQKQYSLCLELYEMSVAVSLTDGKIETVSGRLSEIFSNTKSHDDELNARAMLAKLCLSQGRYEVGFRGVLEILAGLGETFDQDIDRSQVLSEINATLPMLRGITRDKILGLPAMVDTRKLNAMKFMGLLIKLSTFYLPIFRHILSCRMIKLTFQFGFCEDTLTGLIAFSYGLMRYSDDYIDLSKQLNITAETLIKGSCNEHSLRARLTVMSATVSCIVEPFQAAAQKIMNGYHSATIIGDTDSAMMCGLMYCIGSCCCVGKIANAQKKVIHFLLLMAKHKRNSVLHSTMTCFNACTSLIGKGDSCSISTRIEMKTNDELNQIAKKNQNSYLVHHVIIHQMFVHCLFGEYLYVLRLAEKYQINHTERRFFDFIPVFYGGISALCLARDTKQDKWREIGESSVKAMKLCCDEYSVWNFQNKVLLLQAQLHCLDDRCEMAELRYQASIASAHEHRFIHEEALACELYGIYLVENKKLDKGLEQLQIAIDKYKQWGASKKVDDVEDFVELVEHLSCLRKAWPYHGTKIFV